MQLLTFVHISRLLYHFSTRIGLVRANLLITHNLESQSHLQRVAAHLIRRLLVGMPSRRTHVKSRHGCRECKAHRVKACIVLLFLYAHQTDSLSTQCDERQPLCTRCSKHNIVCSYRDSQVNAASSGHSPTPPSQCRSVEQDGNPPLSATIGDSFIPFPPVTGLLGGERTGRPYSFFPDQDLELLHHYTTSTYLSLSDGGTHDKIWQITVPQEAFANAFLLHGILAASALHLAYLRPSSAEQYRKTGMHHYTSAITLFRNILDDISRENSTAVFIFASLIVCISFAIPQGPPQLAVSASIDSVQALIDIFRLERGINGILKMIWPWIQDSAVAPLVQMDLSDAEHPLHFDDEFALKSLEDLIRAEAESETFMNDYLDATRVFRACYPRRVLPRKQRSLIMAWPVLISQGFFTAMSDERPIALAILGFYGAILHDLRDVWWARERGLLVVTACCDLVPPKWESKMLWAKSRVRPAWQ